MTYPVYYWRVNQANSYYISLLFIIESPTLGHRREVLFVRDYTYFGKLITRICQISLQNSAYYTNSIKYLAIQREFKAL